MKVNLIEEKLKTYTLHSSDDAEQFLNVHDKKTLELWGVDFFLDKLNKLEGIVSSK